MNYTLRPFTNEMWAALEEEQSFPSSGSTSLARSPPEGPTVPSRPNTSNSHPEIDPQHLDALQTLGAIPTSSPGPLSRLTGQVSRRNMDETEREGEEEEEEFEVEKEHGSSASITSPHHARSPRSSDIHRAQQNAKAQSETKSQREVTTRQKRQKRQRELEVDSPPPRNLRRRPSPPVASSSHWTLDRNIWSPSSHSQSQSQTTGGPSTSQLPPDHQDDIVVPQTTGSRRPVLDISSGEQLLSSIRDQLREGQFQPYTMPHPKPDGTESGKKWRCAYEFEPGNRCDVAWSRKAEARRHALTHETHLRWICPSLAADGSSCGKLFARQDAARRHVEKSNTCTNLAANRSEGFPILVWEEEDETVANIVTIEWTEDDNDEGNE